MRYYKKSLTLRLFALLLIATLLIPTTVIPAVAVEPRASDYLDCYGAYVYPAGNGLVQVWFDVTGTGYMDELGALTVQIYESTDNENWTWKTTFIHEYNPHMLGHNTHCYGSHVEFYGVVGRYYKAYVCIWGGKDGDGDTRYFFTSAKLAT